MRKSFLAFLIFYLSTFLFFQEEIHGLSHHLREVNHTHSLSCFFDGVGDEKTGIAETCRFHELFIQNSISEFNFFSLLAPRILGVNYFHPKIITNSENFIFFLPLSRAPPKIS